ncbi:YcjX family protein [Roseomonas sp. CCTCC AB2023176]|uniref:YcjX family protein n=1 Tax=Roseomonas sp. CCTCC AB2023176 TaxID=3342640 RepID=UPI0035DE291A
MDPGVVPSRRPPESFWIADYFRMPVFRPPELDRAGAGGVPHIGLDSLLSAAIGDAL